MLRVGLLGHGAIGSQVAEALESGGVPGAELTGVFDPWSDHPKVSVGSMEELIAKCDLVVEAAGHQALSSYGVAVRCSGIDLLVVSVGALADEELLAELQNPEGIGAKMELTGGSSGSGAGGSSVGDSSGSDPGGKLGKLYISTGAIGGLDTFRAVSLLGRIESVTMTSSKPAQNLLRPWMDNSLKEALTQGDKPAVAFTGPARQACSLFPESANICATVALATVGFDQTQVTLIGDPHRQTVRHEIELESESGKYVFTFENRTSPRNPKTSAIVPFSVIRALRTLVNSDEVIFI